MNENNITIITEDDYYRVEYHKRHSLMYVLWKSHLEGDILLDRYHSILEIVKKIKPARWLGNARALHYTTIQDSRWIFDKFIPSLIESSISRYARLESHSSLLILDSMKLQDRLNSLPEIKSNEFEFRFFTDEGLALSWLSSRV
jgi:hypothetical protein